jgi:hypothetical protein
MFCSQSGRNTIIPAVEFNAKLTIITKLNQSSGANHHLAVYSRNYVAAEFEHSLNLVAKFRQLIFSSYITLNSTLQLQIYFPFPI